MFRTRCIAGLYAIFLFTGPTQAENLEIVTDRTAYLPGQTATLEVTVFNASQPVSFYRLEASFPAPSAPISMSLYATSPPAYRYVTPPLAASGVLDVALWRQSDFNIVQLLDRRIVRLQRRIERLQFWRQIFPILRRLIDSWIMEAQLRIQSDIATRNALRPIAIASKIVPVGVDSIPPVIVVPPELRVEATGPLTQVPLPVPAVTDNQDPNPVVTDNAPAGGLFPLGTTTVTFTATDASGNTATAPLFVTVVDTTAPVIVPPPDITVQASAPLTPVAIPLPATVENHDLFINVTNDAPAGGFPLGTTVVTFSGTDLSGNTGTAMMRITVIDNLPPSITVPADITAEATGQLTFPSLPAVLIDDLADPAPLVSVGIPPTGFPLGTTIVPITATDASGNTAIAVWRITIQDTTAPLVTAPADLTVEAVGVLTPVSLPVPVVDDAVDPFPSVDNDAPGAGFPLGTTVVTFSAQDDSGNITTAALQVTVVDTTAPVVTPPGDISAEASGLLTPVGLTAAIVSDLVDPAPVVTNDAPAGGFPLGTTVVTFTATDSAGNSGTAAMQVTVQDTTAPAILGPALVSVPNTGALTMVDLSAITATDLADPAPLLGNDAPAGGFPIGNTVVVFTATDFSGNSATRNITVRVEGAAAVNVTGTWLFDSSTSGERFPLVLQLYQRADNSVLSYGLGGTSALTTLEGGISGDQLTLPLEFTFPGVAGGAPTVVQAVLEGTISGDTMTLYLVDEPAEVFTLVRTTEVLRERVLYFGRGDDIETLENGSLIQLSIVQDSANNFVGGNYSAELQLDSGTNPLFGVHDPVTAFSESAGTVSITVDRETSCGGSGTLSATFNSAERTYAGSYTATGCGPAASGPAAGLAGWFTRTSDTAPVLALYGRLADDLEAEIAFAPAYSVFHPSYLHYGATRLDRLNELDAQVAAYNSIDVVFDRFRNMATTVSSAHPFVARAQSVDFHDRRSGTPAGGGPVEVFHDSDTLELQNDELKYLALSGVWVIRGNRDAEAFGLGLPVLPADVQYQTSGVWPFGMHDPNHPEGHSGFDFELVDGADVYAARGGRIIDIQENRTFPQQRNVTLLSGSFLIDYQHVEAGTLSVSVNTVVSQGDVIGVPAKPCCDDAMCGGAGCCAADYPEAQACAAILHRALHFDVQQLGSGNELCPYDVMTAAARTALDPLLPDSFFDQELVEPFFCNNAQRNGDAFPMLTRWEKTGSVSAANPARIRFTRNAYTDTGYSYQWLDAANTVIAAGTVNFVRHDFNPHQIDFEQTVPSVAIYHGVFVVESAPYAAVLRVDVGSTNAALRPLDLANADAYGPVIEQ